MAKHLPPESEEFHPFGDLIGLQVTGYENAQFQCRLEVEEQLLNPHRVVHGGVIYSMADTAMGGALYTCMDETQLCATIEVKINYFAPVTSGILICTAKVVHKSKRLAALEAEIRNGEQLVAKALGTFSIFPIHRPKSLPKNS
jgi:acyl-CoA thioesterase